MKHPPKESWLERLPLIGTWLSRKASGAPVVGVLRFAGVIGQAGFGRRGITLDDLADSIERAFKLKKLAAVAISINSPGGSPVQSALIARRVRALAEEHDLPVYAFCEDVAASGGYWLACAADHIYADAASVVGSIGVVSAGFGFTELIAKAGVERRIHTAGESKAMLDPFRPEDPKDLKRLKAIQEDVHDQFKDWVRSRRGARLDAPDKVLFDGTIWTGRKALELGLIDGLGDLRGVMREKYGEKVRLRPVKVPRNWLQKRLGMSRTGAVVDDLLAAIEERLTWARYGL
ncbi:MAG: S49 family peptidase [Rhodospirillales bacterium]|nr:MAG: S49 family peptidase [Rhodospirillales bacterium]